MNNPFEVYKTILDTYIDPNSIPHIYSAWNESHRHYHGMNHLKDILSYIEKNRIGLNSIKYDILVLAAFFHDVYYNPKTYDNNEDESIKRFVASYVNQDSDVRNAVIQLIEVTKHRKRPKQELAKLFWDADNHGFYKGYDELLKHEKLLRKEFIHVPNHIWKIKRIEFLKTNIGLFDSSVDKNINKLIEYVKNNY